MIMTLTSHGNSAALIIDNAILEVLRIDMDTPLEIATDGRSLVISPVRNGADDDRVASALDWVNARHGRILRRLAE